MFHHSYSNLSLKSNTVLQDISRVISNKSWSRENESQLNVQQFRRQEMVKMNVYFAQSEKLSHFREMNYIAASL